jgi:hypothetical protein
MPLRGRWAQAPPTVSTTRPTFSPDSIRRCPSATSSSGRTESINGRTVAVSTSFQNASWSCSLALRSR